MRTLFSAIAALALLIGTAAGSNAATHRKHKSAKHHAAATGNRNRTSRSGLSSTAEANLGTKGFPPKPLPAADPRNPADPQKSSIHDRAPAENSVTPPDPTKPTRVGR